MSYKEFEKNDVFYNVIKAKPSFQIKIWNGTAVVNVGNSEAVLNNLLTGSQ